METEPGTTVSSLEVVTTGILGAYLGVNFKAQIFHIMGQFENECIYYLTSYITSFIQNIHVHVFIRLQKSRVCSISDKHKVLYLAPVP